MSGCKHRPLVGLPLSAFGIATGKQQAADQSAQVPEAFMSLELHTASSVEHVDRAAVLDCDLIVIVAHMLATTSPAASPAKAAILRGKGGSCTGLHAHKIASAAQIARTWCLLLWKFMLVTVVLSTMRARSHPSEHPLGARGSGASIRGYLQCRALLG